MRQMSALRKPLRGAHYRLQRGPGSRARWRQFGEHVAEADGLLAELVAHEGVAGVRAPLSPFGQLVG